MFHCDISFLLLVAYDGHFTAMLDKAVNNKVHSANTPLQPYTHAQCCTVVFNIHIYIYIYLPYIIRIMYRSYIIYIMYCRYTYLYRSFDPVPRHVLRAKISLREYRLFKTTRPLPLLQSSSLCCDSYLMYVYKATGKQKET